MSGYTRLSQAQRNILHERHQEWYLDSEAFHADAVALGMTPDDYYNSAEYTDKIEELVQASFDY